MLFNTEQYRILKFLDIEGARKLYWKVDDSSPTVYGLKLDNIEALLHRIRVLHWFSFTRREVQISYLYLQTHDLPIPKCAKKYPQHLTKVQKKSWRQRFGKLSRGEHVATD